jgi:hypothetical protein
MKGSDLAHLAPFEDAYRATQIRADFWRSKLRKGAFGQEGTGSSLLIALRFDREAEEQQIAAGRLAAARRYRGLPPE